MESTTSAEGRWRIEAFSFFSPASLTKRRMLVAQALRKFISLRNLLLLDRTDPSCIRRVEETRSSQSLSALETTCDAVASLYLLRDSNKLNYSLIMPYNLIASPHSFARTQRLYFNSSRAWPASTLDFVAW